MDLVTIRVTAARVLKQGKAAAAAFASAVAVWTLRPPYDGAPECTLRRIIEAGVPAAP